jgi:hypothetical protein
MLNRYYKPEETVQMACPFSIGQAEAGRYTFCVSTQCMAWEWLVKAAKHIDKDAEIPEGWQKADEFDNGQIKIIPTPTHGWCGLVKRSAF